jgi:hypothetical protein
VATLLKNQLLAAFLSVVLVVQGCTSQVVGPKSQAIPGERLSASKGKTVVLLRMKGSIETKLFEEVPLMSGPEERGFGISIKPPGKPANLALVQLHRIDPAKAGQEGWLYFFSEPGDHELEFVQNSGKGQKTLSPSFILRVPRQKSAVYAGSVHFSCRLKGGFWGPTLGECQNIMVTDEGETAQNLAKTLFGESGQVCTSILEKEGARIPPASSQNWFPMGLMTGGAKELASPDWVKRGIARTTGIGEVPGDQIVRGILDWQWIGLAYLLYLPVGASIGAISGKAAEKKWQPCLQRLSREIQQIDPGKLLRQELQGEIKKYSPTPPVEVETTVISRQEVARRNLRSLLKVEVQRILMRECREGGTFSLEIAIKASLSEMPRNIVVYEAELVYSNLNPVLRPGETPPIKAEATWKASACRNMETYCGPEGKKILQEELSRGIHYLVEKLLFELGFFSH